uniref:Solute carrier family 29 member 1a n=1 Tax=Sphenodon punctatus TaxID=8508 RepID=A0A8D0L567_SPHPU
ETLPQTPSPMSVWLIFFTLGLGTLLPWNFFMTATVYFMNRLLNDTGNISLDYNQELNGTDNRQSPPASYLQAKFNNVMTLCAMLPLLVFTCLNSFLHQKIPQQVRILGSLVVIFLVFMVTAILVKIPIEPQPFFIITMVKIVLINSFGAILQGSLFGLAGLLPASYTAPIMSGQGLAGTFAALAMICAIASGLELKDSAVGYFTTACIVVLLAIGAYIMLPRLVHTHLWRVGMGADYTVGTKSVVFLACLAGAPELRLSMCMWLTGPGSLLFPQIWVMALSVCFVFTVTIGVFPAVTAEVKSTIAGSTTWNRYFIPVSCFLMFNVFDWAGRSLTAVCMWPRKDSKLLPSMVAVRVVFIPLFMLCNVQPRQHLPVFFAHDAWFIVFIIFFSISNGYLASLCMCFGPKKVDAHEAETAGAIMTFFLSLGLALGAVISFIFRFAV